MIRRMPALAQPMRTVVLNGRLFCGMLDDDDEACRRLTLASVALAVLVVIVELVASVSVRRGFSFDDISVTKGDDDD